jgi:hypothetical protein
LLPARAISKKNKHLLMVYSTPTRGFTAVLSVFRGTPPTKPLICPEKLSGRLVRSAFAISIHRTRAHHAGRGFDPGFCIFNLATADITWMSGSVRASSRLFRRWFRANKKPCLLSVSRVLENSYSGSSRTCSPPAGANWSWVQSHTIQRAACLDRRHRHSANHDVTLLRPRLAWVSLCRRRFSFTARKLLHAVH